MIEIQNYAAYIQLAIAFNFAFVTFGKEKDVLEKLVTPFKNYLLTLDGQQKNIDQNLKISSRDLPSPNSAFYYKQERRYQKLKCKVNFAERVIKWCQNMRPYYMEPVCMIAGIYSTALLLLIGEINNSAFLRDTLVYYTEFSFCIIGFYAILELRKICKKQKRGKEEIAYLRPLYATVGSFIISLFMAKFHLSFGEFVIPYFTFPKICRWGMGIPYVAFLFCFVVYTVVSLFSFLYVKYLACRGWYYEFSKCPNFYTPKMYKYNIEIKHTKPITPVNRKIKLTRNSVLRRAKPHNTKNK